MRNAAFPFPFPVLACAVLAIAGCGGSGSSSGGTTQPPTAFEEWDCSTCHAAQATTTVTANPAVDGVIAADHQKLGRATCLQCHTDVAALTTLHGTSGAGTPPAVGDGLTATKVDEATCLGCHGSYDQLATATASSTVLTDRNGTTVNPHLAPSLTASHVAAKMTCGSCHGSHATASAMDYCISCHHEGVFQCHTCHA